VGNNDFSRATAALEKSPRYIAKVGKSMLVFFYTWIDDSPFEYPRLTPNWDLNSSYKSLSSILLDYFQSIQIWFVMFLEMITCKSSYLNPLMKSHNAVFLVEGKSTMLVDYSTAWLRKQWGCCVNDDKQHWCVWSFPLTRASMNGADWLSVLLWDRWSSRKGSIKLWRVWVGSILWCTLLTSS
jgi:hypothetical protein